LLLFDPTAAAGTCWWVSWSGDGLHL